MDEDREATLGIPVSTFPAFATNILMGPSTAVDEQVPSQLPTFLVSTNAPELFEQAPSIDANGALIFKTAANKNGRATVTVRLQDSGPSSPAPNSNISAEQTITITINPINDAPQFVIPSTLAVEEDQGVVSITGFASNVLRGPLSATDESTQEVTFFATARNPAAFEIQPSILPDGTLSFKTAKDVNRNTRTSGNATIDLGVLVYLVDNGTGSPLPHSNQSPTQTFTLDVAPVNDPPIPDAFNVPGIEDGSILISASDVLVGDTPGPADEASQTLVLTQVERTSDRGGVIVPVFNGTEIVAFRYTPAVNVANADFFRYVVSDNGSPSRSATGTVTINVAGANDPPQFTPGVPQVFTFEDSGLVSIPWATNILAGPPAAFDEISGPNAQTVSFEVLPNRPELFAQGPAVSSTGVLTFTPALNANGLAVVLVTAVDSGSNVAPNNNRSATATLTISISSVNDAPVFTPGPNISIAEDSGIQTIAWATGIAPAAGLLTTPPTAGDESGQVVDFIVTPSVPSLFAGAPTISATGQLQFTPASNAFGSTAVVVTARDSGAGDGLNQNLSVPRTFTITINPSNDAPQGNTDNYVIGEDQLLSVPARGLLENDTDIDLPADSITAVQVTSTSVLGATVSVSPDGSFTYDPRSVRAIQQLVDNQSISDSFTYRVRDASGTESNLVTVGITVNGSNDAPIAVNDRFPISAGQTVLLAVLANDTDVDSPIDERTIEIGTLPINGTARVLQTGRIEYIPRSGFRGTDTLSYRVRDSFGLLSNEAVVTINTNNPPVAVNDSSNTGVNRSVSINVLRNDFDTDGTLNPSSVEIVVAPSAGTATVGVDGTINYIPPTNFTGTATLSYVVADQEGASSNVATVSIRVSDAIYQNTRDRYDVNADGFVSPIDILLVLNDLNLNRPRRLDPTEFTPPPFIDVNGDGNVGPIDALEVINFLNLRGNGGGEGEVSADAFVPQFVHMVTPEQMIATVGPMVVRELQATLTDSILRAQQDRTTTVPAVASYVDGRLDSVDLAQESLENVLASLSWDRDRENDSELEDEVFGSLIDDLLI